MTAFPKYAGGRGAAYKHAGTGAVVDGKGKGHLIISPSFVEKNFQMANRTQLKMHGMQCYRLGLWGAIGQVRRWGVGVGRSRQGDSRNRRGAARTFF